MGKNAPHLVCNHRPDKVPCTPAVVAARAAQAMIGLASQHALPVVGDERVVADETHTGALLW